MSKLYKFSTGQRLCDTGCGEAATTRRKFHEIWYAVCQDCARIVDEMKEREKDEGKFDESHN